jgi:quinoprotein glucose dehydrogenase
VPASDIPGEQAWPTQPFPTGLPTTARQGMTADDVIRLFLTSEEHDAWRARVAAAASAGFSNRRTGL